MFYGEFFALTAACLWGLSPIFIRKGLPYASVSVGLLCGLGASLPLMVLVFALHPRAGNASCDTPGCAVVYRRGHRWSMFGPDV